MRNSVIGYTAHRTPCLVCAARSTNGFSKLRRANERNVYANDRVSNRPAKSSTAAHNSGSAFAASTISAVVSPRRCGSRRSRHRNSAPIASAFRSAAVWSAIRVRAGSGSPAHTTAPRTTSDHNS
ncbi:hypothetical protein [Gemmata massiliana]|uniref:hypothetical protein n=1 Tax=Gemmata massiliana TaxID=1210884 RepID=UPI0013A6C9DB|nr:hypothetical protein [Gemmata massiliana]